MLNVFTNFKDFPKELTNNVVSVFSAMASDVHSLSANLCHS